MTLRYIAWTVTRGSVADGLKAPQTKPTGLFSMTNIVKANDEKQWRTCPGGPGSNPRRKKSKNSEDPGSHPGSGQTQQLQSNTWRISDKIKSDDSDRKWFWILILSKKRRSPPLCRSKKNQKVTRVLWAGDQSFLFCRLSVSFQSRSTLLQWFYS